MFAIGSVGTILDTIMPLLNNLKIGLSARPGERSQSSLEQEIAKLRKALAQGAKVLQEREKKLAALQIRQDDLLTEAHMIDEDLADMFEGWNA